MLGRDLSTTGWESPNSDEGRTLWYSLYVRTLCVNRSQTHKCGNWDFGHAIPFLGIFVINFLYWFFAVHHVSLVMAN